MIKRSISKLIVLSFLVIVLGVVALLKPEEGNTIPPFARKYKTSCYTCHIAFPKLNAFGRAFKRNGYFWPGGGDKMMRKDKPINLGKGLFGKEATINERVPLGFAIEAVGQYSPKRRDKSQKPETTTAGIEEFELLAGGTIGDSIGYLGILAYLPGDNEWDLDAAQVIFNDIFGPANMFNIRVGKLMGGPMKADPHDSLTPTGFKVYAANLRNSIQGATVSNAVQNGAGIEINGILGGRFYYGVGLVTNIAGGNFDDNYQKDFYSFVEYQVGGMRLDGEDGPAGDKPWEDDHIKLRGHFLAGTVNLGTNTAPINDKRISLGGELEVWFSRLQFVGTGFYQIHDLETGSGSGTYGRVKALGITAELAVILGSTGWFIPSIRWEHLTYKAEDQNGTRTTSGPNEDWLNIGTLFQVRTNVQLLVGMRLMLHASDLDAFLSNSPKQNKTVDVVEAKLKFAF